MQRLSLLAAGTVLLACGCAGRGDATAGAGGATGAGSGAGTGAGTGLSTGTGGAGKETGTGGDVDAGSITGAGAGTGVDGGPTVVAPPSVLSAPDPCTSNAPGPRKLWRLSGPEFSASIHSIFGDTAGGAPVAAVFSDPTTLGFSIDANSLLIQGLNASQLEDNAEAIAAWAATSGKLSQFATCAATATGAPAATCASRCTARFSWRAARTRTGRKPSSRRCCSLRIFSTAASSVSRSRRASRSPPSRLPPTWPTC